MSPELQDKLLRQMATLSPDQQEKVLAFAKSLAPAAGGVSGKDLLKFSGAIGHADLHLMAAAIEQDFEGNP